MEERKIFFYFPVKNWKYQEICPDFEKGLFVPVPISIDDSVDLLLDGREFTFFGFSGKINLDSNSYLDEGISLEDLRVKTFKDLIQSLEKEIFEKYTDEKIVYMMIEMKEGKSKINSSFHLKYQILLKIK